MKITLEIDDALIPSVQQYLSTQVDAENDKITKAQRLVPRFAGVEDWIQGQVGTLLHQVLMQYPTPEIRTQLEQAHAIQEQIKEMAKPKRVND